MAHVPKKTHGKTSLACSIHCCSMLFISFARPASLCCEEYCIYTHIWLCKDCVYITVASKQYCKWNTFTSIRSGVMYWVGIYDWGTGWQWRGKYVSLDQTFYSPLDKPLTLVSKSEPGEHPFQVQRWLQCFCYCLMVSTKSFCSHSLLFCGRTVNTFWYRPMEGNNKCLCTEAKILRYVTKIHTLINWSAAFPWF